MSDQTPEPTEEPSDLFKGLENARVAFGLAAQGHIPTVERMRAGGASWDEVGKAIGWCGDAVERFYGYHLAANAKQAPAPITGDGR